MPIIDGSNKELDEMFDLMAQGKTVLCKVCGTPLVHYGPGSGGHPRIECSNLCTRILLEYPHKSDQTGDKSVS